MYALLVVVVVAVALVVAITAVAIPVNVDGSPARAATSAVLKEAGGGHGPGHFGGTVQVDIDVNKDFLLLDDLFDLATVRGGG